MALDYKIYMRFFSDEMMGWSFSCTELIISSYGKI